MFHLSYHKPQKVSNSDSEMSAQKNTPQRGVLFVSKLVLLVADVACLCRIKAQVADGSYQGVNAKGQVCQEEVSSGSAGVAFGLQRSVVDDEAADETQEEGQQKTNQIVVGHCSILLSSKMKKV